MEKKERTYTLKKEFAEHLLNILRHKGYLDDAGDDELLGKIEVDFEDGMIVEITVFNGSRDDNTSPYVNVNWFKDNRYLYAMDTDPEGELIGTYDFVFDEEDEDINYLLHLVISEEGQTFRI